MNRRNFLKGFIAATTVAALAPVSLVEVPVTQATKFVNFDELARITLEKYRPVFADFITRESVWTKIIQSRKADGTLRECSIDGGIEIVEPILTGLK